MADLTNFTLTPPPKGSSSGAGGRGAGGRGGDKGGGRGRSPSPQPRVAGERLTADDFEFIQLLGRGDVGRVYLARRKSNKKLYAVKKLSKQDMIKRNKIKRALTEREILATSDHPFIVTMYHCFQSAESLYFVMDYCAGGEFFRVLQRQPKKRLPEDQVRFYMSEVISALEYLHLMGFIYRDLKPENILLHANGHIMLTDFDLSKQSIQPVKPKVVKSASGKSVIDTRPELVTNSFVGTEEYIAPEVITGHGHNSTVDWWTVGVLGYELAFGFTPFRGRHRDETFQHILNDSLVFPSSPETSKEFRHLIRSLLNPDPAKRLGAQHGASDIKAHPFFKDVNWALILNEKPPILPKLSSDVDTRYFRKFKDDVAFADTAMSHEDVDSPSNPFRDFGEFTRQQQ